MKEHTYSAVVTWTGNTGPGTKNYRSYHRNFSVMIDGKPEIKGSADPAFLGDKSVNNPEELFVASISSCHLLWYLHLCSENGITVVDYRDNATGIMAEEKNGAGYFSSVTLRPRVIILESARKALAGKLHHQANKMCFIANSCNFKIGHEPVIEVREEP